MNVLYINIWTSLLGNEESLGDRESSLTSANVNPLKSEVVHLGHNTEYRLTILEALPYLLKMNAVTWAA